MEDRRTLRLTLCKGESRQLLLEAGSLILLLEGRAELQGALEWLAETTLRPKLSLSPEEAHRLENGGWIAINASRAAEIVVIPPDDTSFWLRVGRCLERLAGHRQSGRNPCARTVAD